MIPSNELVIFILAAFGLVITPGPNMIYLISRSISQGKKAGFISLLGVISGFLFHIILVSFGLTTILMSIPFTYFILKTVGVFYLLYLAFEAIKISGKNVFQAQNNLTIDNPPKLFSMGFFTNVLNPKIAFFYVSFFPQFIKTENGSVFSQSIQLGLTQMAVSFMVNLLIVLSAAKCAQWFNKNPVYLKIQRWFMATILASLALKMALDKK
ncbi:LysE family translocator [Lacihabitans soyangensis]|uniref:LysE family translocator n=1 Tax=Lacihabitans soyangensis TaxID=869394 RepID=A0AAE3KRS5_9BACT|nr:LysE family translocator [Lacihabitans soyangensis]MCP9761799.1 LysE family translocator [Lacihabitans soyangensis]